MHLYEEQFSESHDFPRVQSPSKVLVIASTGRSGSHMLGHALHETHRFGFPLEYANPANLSEWKRRLDIDDLQGVMAEIKRRRTSPNGVFGIKLHYPHIKLFGGFDNVIKCFPDAYYILLSRKNLLKQAVSLSIASQTGVWISGQKAVNDNPQYDFAHIDKCLRETILNNASWRYTLAANGCNYIEMDFDHVRHDLDQAINDIARFMGIEIDPADIPRAPVTKKQSNLRNAEWEKRFISDFNASGVLLSNAGPSILKRVESKVKRMLYE
ncbi:Stf0 sulfotransferase [Billgrantia antri]|uniref:Stf0 sulfotransferase n=1 Tax=Halomonas sulfidivorans TaxID=2733488 RepID=A0ABX7WH69_9GAMM|nr:Stf0 family sulfotransferase [Halomonas sulfidivorans]QTP59396.1 Stf0 sulfotransferase [Halomonas sulfidivorans]